MVLCCHYGSVTGHGRTERFWIKFGHFDARWDEKVDQIPQALS